MTVVHSRRLIICILLYIAIMLIPPSRGCLLSGPVNGRVVDADSGAPVADAVIVAVWFRNIWGGVDTVSKFFTAKEAVTGANGEFRMPVKIGISLNPLGIFRAPLFSVFKPGFQSCPTFAADAVGTCSFPTIRLHLLKKGELLVDPFPSARVTYEYAPNLHKAWDKATRQ